MADFCKQCSIELFGEDNKDLANLGRATKKDNDNGFYIGALCEDCGYTLVDIEGNCVANCLKHHGTKDNPLADLKRPPS